MPHRVAEDLKLFGGSSDTFQDLNLQEESDVQLDIKTSNSLTSTSSSHSLLSCSDSQLMEDVTSVVLKTLTRVLAVECRTLIEDDVKSYVQLVTRTYGPLRENFPVTSDTSVSTEK